MPTKAGGIDQPGSEKSLSRVARTIPKYGVSGSTAIAGKCGVFIFVGIILSSLAYYARMSEHITNEKGKITTHKNVEDYFTKH